jgi:hypothetical protein
MGWAAAATPSATADPAAEEAGAAGRSVVVAAVVAAPPSPRLCGSAPAQTLVDGLLTLSQAFYSLPRRHAAAADADTAVAEAGAPGGSVTVVEAAVAVCCAGGGGGGCGCAMNRHDEAARELCAAVGATCRCLRCRVRNGFRRRKEFALYSCTYAPRA